MKTIVLLWGIFLLSISFLACAIKSTPTERYTSAISPVQEPQAALKETWQVEWENTIIEARKEGKVILYNSWMPPLREAIAKGFKDKYGIELESVSGRTAELAEKILRERKAVIYSADAFLAGSQVMTISLKPQGILEPIEPVLILPEVKDPSVWWMGKLNFTDKDHLILNFMAYPGGSEDAVINTQLVKKEELSNIKDLLNPKWNKRIIMYEPVRPGKAQNSTIRIGYALGWNFWREFIKQMPVLTSDQRQVVEWVARGKYPLGLFYQDILMTSFKELGSPLEGIGFQELNYLTGGIGHISLFKNAPNPNARKVFVNWLLTREGQTIFSKVNITHSTRLDVPVDHLPADKIRREGVNYLDNISEEWTLGTMEEGRKLTQEIFGPLLK